MSINTESKRVIAGKAALPPISEPASTSFRLMASAARDFVCVDMRGMKAALLERAASRGVSVSQVVREIVGGALASPVPSERGPVPSRRSRNVKVSIRLSCEAADQLVRAAAMAGVSRGLLLERMMGSAATTLSAASVAADRAALVRSNAELAGLIRQMSHLVALLRMGSVSAALEYADMLSSLQQDVRRHVKHAGTLLGEMRRRRASPGLKRHVEAEEGHADRR